MFSPASLEKRLGALMLYEETGEAISTEAEPQLSV